MHDPDALVESAAVERTSLPFDDADFATAACLGGALALVAADSVAPSPCGRRQSPAPTATERTKPPELQARYARSLTPPGPVVLASGRRAAPDPGGESIHLDDHRSRRLELPAQLLSGGTEC
jgi:hypothetical protein